MDVILWYGNHPIITKRSHRAVITIDFLKVALTLGTATQTTTIVVAYKSSLIKFVLGLPMLQDDRYLNNIDLVCA